jgi:hypothetical protein
VGLVTVNRHNVTKKTTGIFLSPGDGAYRASLTD